MDEADWLAERFEEQRAHLGAVAYRMLGSHAEAEDAVQNSWLRLSRADAAGIENLGGWLTTVVARECLNMLRTRRTHREEPLAEATAELPADGRDASDPEAQALLADSVGPALMVVLDALGPAERLAFVLHDIFAVPFDEIGPILDRSPAATRQLASRARRRVQGVPPPQPVDLAEQRRVADAFLAALREGDFGALVAVLDPEVVLWDDSGSLPPGNASQMRGAEAVAAHALKFRHGARWLRPAVVAGAVGLALTPFGRLAGALRFRVAEGRIAEIELVSKADGLALVELDQS